MTKTFNLQRFDTDMLAPSKKLVAKAIPVDGGWIAQFSAPGLVPRYVGWSQDNPKVFATAEAAEEEARLAAFEVFNKPRETQARGRNVRIAKLSGPEAADLIARAGVTLTWLAHVATSGNVDRVQSWVDGIDNMPHPVRLLLEAIIAHPDLADLFEDITDSVASERRPR